MNLLSKTWGNFKSQPDIWFFYAFLTTFTLSIRKVLFFYPIQGKFNEYSGAYLYLTDILILLTFLFWIIPKLCNKKSYMSIENTLFNLHQPAGQIGKILLLPLLLVLLSLTSIFWATNLNIATFRAIKILEFLLLFLYIVFRIVPRGTILKKSFEIIILTGLIQSSIGLCQFIKQHSIGLFWLKESIIGPDILGVAKVILNDNKFIRSYGLFPHPNIFGGFLLFSISITYIYTRLFRSCLAGRWNNSQQKTSELIHNIHIINIILVLQFIALFFTFSKSAIIGLFLASTYIIIKGFVPRGTFLSKKILLISLIAFVSILLAKPNLHALFIKSLDERVLYLNVSRGTIATNPIFGLGIGQFVIKMQSYANTQLFDWEFQPVHNVFLIIWSELGLIGLLIFIIFLWKLFHLPAGQVVAEYAEARNNKKCSTWNISENNLFLQVDQNGIKVATFTKGILVGLIFIMFFDHYLWDIQQGEILLWMTLAFLFDKNTTSQN